MYSLLLSRTFVIVIDKIHHTIIILNRQKIVHALHNYYTRHKGHARHTIKYFDRDICTI